MTSARHAVSRGRLAHARKSTETEFETHHGGGCFLTTVGGTLTGRGGHFLIIDDPLKAGEAASPVALRNHIEWFFNTFLSRRNRPKDTPIILSMQRLHMNDLSGMLIGLGWPSLIMPAIAVEDEVFEVGGGAKHYRRKGDLLQPGWDSREELAKTKKADAYIFSAQYQQNPVPAEGVKVKREHLRSYRKHPPLERFRHIYVSCDPAGKSGPKNDYTAITVVGILDRDVYLLDVKRGHWSYLQIKRNMLAMYEKWKATRMLIETTGLGEAVRQEIVGENRYDIFGRQPKLDKPTRMDRLMAIFEGGHFFLPAHADWLAEFSTELLTFPHTDNDDQVDALMLALEDFKEREYSDLAYSGVCLDGCVNYRDNPYSAEQFSNRGV